MLSVARSQLLRARVVASGARHLRSEGPMQTARELDPFGRYRRLANPRTTSAACGRALSLSEVPFFCAIGVSVDQVTLKLEPGSVIATFTIYASSVGAKSKLVTQLQSIAATKEDMTNVFAGTGAPLVLSDVILSVTFLKGPPPDYTPLIAGAAAGAAGLCLCLSCAYYFLVFRVSRSKLYSPTIVPA